MDWWWSGLAFVVALGLAHALRSTLDVAPLQRTNYRGNAVPTGGGIAAVFAFAIVSGIYALVHRDRVVLDLIVVTGFGAIGFFDDVVGTHAARGLRGHLHAARRGQLTSGAIKLVVGFALAVAIAPAYPDELWKKVVAAVVIAGAANAANLFDLAPGRATKVMGLCLAALAIGWGASVVAGGPLWFYAATLGLLAAEMRERLMLGDAGANALGAMVGLAAVRATVDNAPWLVAVAAIVIGVNVLGEFVSFSAIIDRTPPLRAIDRLGRLR